MGALHRRFAAMLALGLTLMLTLAFGTVPASAQDATPGAGGNPSAIGVVDAGSRIVWNANDPAALVYQLTVLEFADAARAASSFDQITDSTSGLLSPGDATPAAEVTAVAGLDETTVDLADEAVLYYQPDASGAAGIATLFVLDGAFVHQWSVLPVPIPENTLRIDPTTLPEALKALAEPWFVDGHEGDALAQLPNIEQFPTGYEVLSETSGLDALGLPADPDATPGAAGSDNG